MIDKVEAGEPPRAVRFRFPSLPTWMIVCSAARSFHHRPAPFPSSPAAILCATTARRGCDHFSSRSRGPLTPPTQNKRALSVSRGGRQMARVAAGAVGPMYEAEAERHGQRRARITAENGRLLCPRENQVELARDGSACAK
uniref:Uncharacterized protein n=1 Tax=Plectus sambesii TaxID=2011161 RepID=A0A914W436_9BILA